MYHIPKKTLSFNGWVSKGQDVRVEVHYRKYRNIP